MAKGVSWSMKELQQALRMKRKGATCAEIAVALGRSTAAVEAKFKSFRRPRADVPITPSRKADKRD